jgi:hypothetical protein
MKITGVPVQRKYWTNSSHTPQSRWSLAPRRPKSTNTTSRIADLRNKFDISEFDLSRDQLGHTITDFHNKGDITRVLKDYRKRPGGDLLAQAC